MREWNSHRILITVRTYPVPAWRGVEVSCTAGITAAGKWIRLHPVPYRLIDEDQKFKKYQWLEVSLKKSADPRPESFTPNLDDMRVVSEVLGTRNSWSDRRAVVMPLRDESMCELQRIGSRPEGQTLGLVRARSIRRLQIEETDPSWTEEQIARLKQENMFYKSPKEPLEKIPFIFSYEYLCDDSVCNGHTMSCNDWEMLQAYRRWSDQYGVNWESEFRGKFEQEMSEKYDTHFFVGTHSRFPNTWMIVGLWYPPKTPYMERLLG